MSSFSSSLYDGASSVYNTTARIGRMSGELGFYIALVTCVSMVLYGAYVMVWGNPAAAFEDDRKTKAVEGGMLSGLGMLVLAGAWLQRWAVDASKVYASASGVSSLASGVF